MDIYDACVKRQMYADKFEFTRQRVRRRGQQLVDGSKVTTLERAGSAGLNVYKERFLVAHHRFTLCRGPRAEKIARFLGLDQVEFDFDTERVCVVHSRGR